MSTSNNAPAAASGSTPLAPGAIAGAVIGSLLGTALLATTTFYVLRRRARRNRAKPTTAVSVIMSSSSNSSQTMVKDELDEEVGPYKEKDATAKVSFAALPKLPQFSALSLEVPDSRFSAFSLHSADVHRTPRPSMQTPRPSMQTRHSEQSLRSLEAVMMVAHVSAAGKTVSPPMLVKPLPVAPVQPMEEVRPALPRRNSLGLYEHDNDSRDTIRGCAFADAPVYRV